MISGDEKINSTVVKATSVEELLNGCPVNQTICDNLIRAYAIINNTKYKKIVCAISGGSDSDVMLDIFGVRKAEGGARVRYGNCFDESDKYDNYRPLFWYKDSDKEDYEKAYGIVHSKCYTEYGLKRTGCCGCPYGRDFENELDVIEKYEPKLYKAVTNIFKDSYEYTRKYVEFRKMMDEKERIR